MIRCVNHKIISIVSMTCIYSIHTSYFNNTIGMLRSNLQHNIQSGAVLCHHSIYIECNKKNY